MRSSSSWIVPALVLVPMSLAYADGGPQHRVKQTPPVKMGTSGGSANDRSGPYCCGGTLGALVSRDGVLSILSNNHVLARSGTASTGEDTLQPGLLDNNCSANNTNIVGDFAGNLVPLGSANVDAAISTARTTVDATGAILDIGVPCTALQTPAIGMPVMKSGRTTGFTTGTITSINTSVTIQYRKKCNGGQAFNVNFTNQVVTGAMSAGGDSGSLLVSNDGTPNPVGLLFAGSASVTVYNPIQSVVNAFTAGGHTFTFVGNNCGPLTEDAPAPAPPDEEIQAALVVKVQHESDLFSNPGVLGVGIGQAEDNPIEAVIVVYVSAPPGRAIAAIPDQIDGFRVRVIHTDKIVAQ
jgi:hypothetical protein